MSHISPLRKGDKITKKECDSIIFNTRKVLDEAIETVSYTHLDVYKRQVHDYAKAA